jgi:hypothetical protein
MMALFDLIHKPKSTPLATLTVATQGAEPLVTVAKVASVTVANYTESKSDNTDDRHHCRECQNLRNGYCTRQRFRPVDDIPRRCEDFSGYPGRIGQSASDTHPTSEAEHNAQGRFFKFLATWPDGRQCYLCQMPRQTVDEMRAQFPDATHIEPITGEHYDD